MVIVRFVWLLLFKPLLTSLSLLPLIVAWAVLAIIVGLWTTWERAKGNEVVSRWD